ncbi:hypothetical protein [Herbihabitans rhizosphaerae]|uniref:hypothetical protein n=1 Tax=Herbihabitans rhizosphaerae TaxID=1872711 RepID=UPI00102AA8C8|nr:hypothetical protein [Herbihabitans rhizosphaerae]
MIVAVVLSALVAGGAMAGAAALRARSADSGTPPVADAPPSVPVEGDNGCRVEPCQTLTTVPVPGGSVELIADNGGRSGRLKINGSSSSSLVEITITNRGVVLTNQSLQCLSLSISACLVSGTGEGGRVGEVVVGRSGSWNGQAQPYFSDADYLGLTDVRGDGTPDVVTVQHDCGTRSRCTGAPVFAQVYGLDGQELGCTRTFTRLTQLPGWPSVKPTPVQLKPCD